MNQLDPVFRVAMILCGGHSSRMGYDKARLPFGDQAMIQRMVEILIPTVEKVVVVSRKSLELPALPSAVDVVYDQRPSYGPLEGLRVGLKWLDQNPAESRATRPGSAYAFVTSCDTPLLKPDFVRMLFESVEQAMIAVPQDGRFLHPLCAVYRTDLWQEIIELQSIDEHRPRALFDRCETKRILVDEFRSLDPNLESLFNLNSPADYFHALQLCGLKCPEEIRQLLSLPE